MTVLSAAMTVFEGLHYVDTYASIEGHVLRSAARVGDRQFEGVDIVRLDEAGLVTELTVMIRPFHALGDLVAAMGVAVGQR